MPAAVYAYLFEAKAIQNYLFLGGKLRDVVGASDLVANIASPDDKDMIGEVLGALRIDGQQISIVKRVDQATPPHHLAFSRRAGGAFRLHGQRATLVAVRRAFRLALMKALPGLEFTDALGEGEDENASMQSAFGNAGGLRSNAVSAVLPLGRPVFAVVPRTGLPMVAETHKDDPLDRLLAVQRGRADLLAKRGVKDGVAERFHPSGKGDYRYPRNLDDDDEDTTYNPIMPWRPVGDRRVALVHADISGLGQLYSQAGCANAYDSLTLAKRIDEILLASVRKANDELILHHAEPHVAGTFLVAPARPLVLGGDDVTLIIRADLALPFTVRLLELIEQESQSLCKEFPNLRLPKALSACAGVAISRAGLPFLTMNALAESLCAYAKEVAKGGAPSDEPYASLLAFHVQTQTAEEDYFEHILPGQRQFTGNPYRVGSYAAHLIDHPEWRDLEHLAKAIDGLRGAANSLRRIKALVGNNRTSEANDIWHRMHNRTDRTANESTTPLLDAITAVTGVPTDRNEVPRCGALFDALELLDLQVAFESANVEAAA